MLPPKIANVKKINFDIESDIPNDDLFEDDDLKDYEWIEALANHNSGGQRSQLLELMERLNVYDEEQLHLALRNHRQSPHRSAEIETEFPRPNIQSISCPSSPTKSVIASKRHVGEGLSAPKIQPAAFF